MSPAEEIAEVRKLLDDVRHRGYGKDTLCAAVTRLANACEMLANKDKLRDLILTDGIHVCRSAECP